MRTREISLARIFESTLIRTLKGLMKGRYHSLSLSYSSLKEGGTKREKKRDEVDDDSFSFLNFSFKV